MTHEEAIRWWFGRVNFELTTPTPSDLRLDRMRLLLERLGNPQQRFGIVHIAGSKGKGSTAAMLAAVLQRAGFRTGLFTSPHLTDVTERIQVDGRPITGAELAALLGEIRAAAAAPRAEAGAPLDDSLTFFEIATALGFLHFARRGADWVVLEVGLGGRFDSTNVCDPRLAVITSISLDHTQQLGNTLASIAGEKAGIIKPGRPTISGVVTPEAREVIRQVCRERGSALRERETDFRCTHEAGRFNGGVSRWPRVTATTWRRAWPELAIGLIGAHQAANAALVIAAVECLREQGAVIPDQAVASGLAEVHWPARLEVLGKRPLVLLDCAHNVASAQALADALLTSFPLAAAGRRLLVFAGSRDKDLAGMLEVLAPCVEHVYLTRFASPRCAAPEELARLLPARLAQAHSRHDSNADAWRRARQDAGPDDLICITGSVFLAGELRPVVLGPRAGLSGA